MKLNIGCGYDHLDGYMNLDSNPDSAADRLMQAWDLKFADGSVSEIKAYHVIEHLGFFRARYFLAECWRVLGPGGALLLETPCIEKTFEAFLGGDLAAKEAALGWVYGSESPGMNHLFCFPRDLLAGSMSEAGFIDPVFSEPPSMPSRPSLRAVAVKGSGERAALNSALRRRLLDSRLAPSGSEEEAAGLELALGALMSAGSDRGAALAAALYSAPAALEYFSLLEENEPRPSREGAAAARLVSGGLQALLFSAFRAARLTGAGPGPAYEKALEAGRCVLRSVLSGGAAPPEGKAGGPAVFTPASAEEWLRRETARRQAANTGPYPGDLRGGGQIL